VIFLDHMDGAFDSFETDIKQNEDGTWTASALGVSKSHQFQELALNDLNEEIYNKVSRGELVPGMGN
jgi:hypothetical protein